MLAQVTSVTAKTKDGREETLDTDAVVFAIGITGKPINQLLDAAMTPV